MNKEVVTGIVRHLLTAIGGVLVAHGTLTQVDVNTGVGATVAIVGIIWSAMQKKGKAKEIEKILAEGNEKAARAFRDGEAVGRREQLGTKK